MRLHQGLARKAQQPRQALGCDTHDAVAISVGRRSRASRLKRVHLLGLLRQPGGRHGRHDHRGNDHALPVDQRLTAPASAPALVHRRSRKCHAAARSLAVPRKAMARTCCGSRSSLARLQFGHQRIDFIGVLGLPCLDLRFAELGNLGKHVHAPKQDVNMFGPKRRVFPSAPRRSSLPSHERLERSHRVRRSVQRP